MQFAIGIDRLVFLPDCDDSIDSVLPSCSHGSDSTTFSAQAPAGNIDADTGVDITLFTDKSGTDVAMQAPIDYLAVED